jgi:hypothetical protein
MRIAIVTASASSTVDLLLKFFIPAFIPLNLLNLFTMGNPGAEGQLDLVDCVSSSRMTSDVWPHFGFRRGADGKADKSVAVCKLCTAEIVNKGKINR